MIEVRRYEGLENLPEDYVAVFEQAGQESIFLSLPWFLNFEQTILGPNEHALIYGVEENNSPRRPMGAFILKSPSDCKEFFAPRIMESLSNYYTSYFAPAIVNDYPDVSFLTNALASALWVDRRSWDVLRLQPFDSVSPIYLSLVNSLRQCGMFVQTYFCFGNWYLDLAGRSYREYLNDLPNVLRKNIPYLGRRLEKNYRLRITLLTGEEGLEEALDHYEKVYNASWRTMEAYPQFIRGLVRTAAAKGWLRFGLLYLDEEPAAVQLWIVHAGVAYIYKICYDERFSKLSVGTVLTARMMEHVIDVDRVRKVDYLSGDDDYKKNWMSHRAERWGVLAFNPHSFRGLAQSARHIGGRFVKRASMRLFQSSPLSIRKINTMRWG